jgi:hypothetical protein
VCLSPCTLYQAYCLLSATSEPVPVSSGQQGDAIKFLDLEPELF